MDDRKQYIKTLFLTYALAPFVLFLIPLTFVRARFFGEYFFTAVILAVILLVIGLIEFSMYALFKLSKVPLYLWILRVGVILFILYFFTFTFIRPIGGVITENPILIKLCEMQNECGWGWNEVICGYINHPEWDINERPNYQKLLKWQGYEGCNNNSRWYREDNNFKWVQMPGCFCAGIM